MKLVNLYRKIESKFAFRYIVIILCFFFALVFGMFSDWKIILGENYDIKYKTYQNINVSVEKNLIHGKLNKHMKISSFNNHCYIDFCGFANAGEYQLDKIKFISINDKWFLLEVCDSPSMNCFINLKDNAITNIKLDLLSQAKYNIKLGVFFIIVLIIIGFFDSKRRYM